jgi:hydrogenase expression/formation protein HypD
MLRVPGARGSLEAARSTGADVRVVYSALDVIKHAQANPQRQVVFGAVGFETTAPATAALIIKARQLGLSNLSVLVSHKRVVPAIEALLRSRGGSAALDPPYAGGKGPGVKLDGLLCPGHVSVVIGSSAYEPIVRAHRMPCVIAGFEAVHIVLGLAQLTELARDGKAELVNHYPEAVTPGGNRVAQDLMAQVFVPGSARWRGLGVIPQSGLALRPEFADFDAAMRFGLTPPEDREPPGCLCGRVITGLATPRDCALFGTRCTPIHPIGPCMVSSEGTCQAWFKYRRQPVATSGTAS